MTYSNTLKQLQSRYPSGAKAGIAIEDLAQLKTQNTYKTHFGVLVWFSRDANDARD